MSNCTPLTHGSYFLSHSAFVAKLLVREGNFLDKVNPCLESDHLEYTVTVDDSNSQVPTGKEYSETVIDNIGICQQFYLYKFFTCYEVHIMIIDVF